MPLDPPARPLRVLTVGGQHHEPLDGETPFLRRPAPGAPYPTDGAVAAEHAAHFHLPAAVARLGRLGANRALLEYAVAERPDVAHVGAVWYELLPGTLLFLRHAGVFLVGHRDADHMNFWSYARFLFPLHDFMVTNDRRVKGFYDAIRMPSFLHPYAQVGAAPAIPPKSFDVAYVGHAMNLRVQAVRSLRALGVDIRCWGPGWLAHPDLFGGDSGGVAFDPATGALSPGQMQRAYGAARFGIDLSGLDGGQPALRNRDFEIPLSGALLLTPPKPGLAECFVPGREILVYRTLDEAARLVRTLSSEPRRLARMTTAGHARARAEHSGEGARRGMWEAIAPVLRAARERTPQERLADLVSDACRAVLLREPLDAPLGGALAAIWNAQPVPLREAAAALLKRRGVQCRIEGGAAGPRLRVLQHAPLEEALARGWVRSMALAGAAPTAA